MKTKYLLALTLVTVTTTQAASLTSIENAQLDSYLGSDYDYTNVWHGVTGATAESFHTAVDGVGPTVSIYDITVVNTGQHMRIGGYTSKSWAATSDSFQYVPDTDAFIFNLTKDELQNTHLYLNNTHGILRHKDYFPTFGGGHDIFGGTSALNNMWSYTNNHTYNNFDGNIIDGSSYGRTYFDVNSLDVYTLNTAKVPEPSSLFLTILVGFITYYRKRMSNTEVL